MFMLLWYTLVLFHFTALLAFGIKPRPVWAPGAPVAQMVISSIFTEQKPAGGLELTKVHVDVQIVTTCKTCKNFNSKSTIQLFASPRHIPIFPSKQEKAVQWGSLTEAAALEASAHGRAKGSEKGSS